MIEMDISKYENSVLNNLDSYNADKIIDFLILNNCDYVEELLIDYLDIFTFDYDEFLIKFNALNKKYKDDLINAIKEDMNILEEFYY